MKPPDADEQPKLEAALRHSEPKTAACRGEGLRIGALADVLRFVRAHVRRMATRQLVCCTITGRGVGVAAVQSIKDDVTCTQVDIGRVRERLVAQGVTLS